MKVSYNWLNKYVDTDLSPERMCEILTDTGLEVEGLHKVEAVRGGLEGVVIGEVLTCEKHPDADRLKVATVSTGADSLQIVCGAPNVTEGIKVVVATAGCTLYPTPEEAFKIKKSKIRGVESNGMLCAEDELGLGNSHDGILILDEAIEVGTKASTYFNLEDDYEIEIGLTPNRSDAMGHIGVARDLVAYLNVHERANLSLNIPNVDGFEVNSNDLKIEVSVENNEMCPRYMGTTIKAVEVKPSPTWLQKRLRSIGLSPINNVVDVTNFVMHELGTPLHAFDVDKLKGSIVVKQAQDKDKFTTLDDVERELSSSNLMITNGTDNLCIAGVLGGDTSGITENTKDVFLESAYFNPVAIRKTAKMHGLNTDASFRYERGVDSNMTEYALKRAALLIQEVAGGKVAMDIVDTNPGLAVKNKVEFDYDRSNALIGTELSKDYVNQILRNLDINVISENKNTATLEIPTYRVDVTREADVVEEVLRIYGFNNVPLPSKLNTSISNFKKPDQEKLQNTVSELLVARGFFESMNNSLTKSGYVSELGGDVLKSERNVAMLNPLSQDLDVMRQSLLFNALETVTHNQNRQNPNLKLFEFGKIYHQFESGFSENKRLMIAITGDKVTESWNSTKEAVSYYTIKGIVNGVLQRVGLDGMIREKGLKNSLLEDGVQLYILKNKIGEIGWASATMKKKLGVKNDVFVADLDWDSLISCLPYAKIKYTELPKTFAVRRDFSLLLDDAVKFSDIQELAHASDKKILKSVGLFDVYAGKNLEEGKKSYAISFMFQDTEKTLKDEQVDSVMERIKVSLESKLKAQLR